MIVGEDGSNIDPHCGLQMQRVEGPQVRHGQETGPTVNGPIEDSECDAAKDTGHIGLVESVPDRVAAQLGLEKIAGSPCN